MFRAILKVGKQASDNLMNNISKDDGEGALNSFTIGSIILLSTVLLAAKSGNFIGVPLALCGIAVLVVSFQLVKLVAEGGRTINQSHLKNYCIFAACNVLVIIGYGIYLTPWVIGGIVGLVLFLPPLIDLTGSQPKGPCKRLEGY